MKFFVIFFLQICSAPSFAGVLFSASGSATSGSSSGTVSAGYEGEFSIRENVPFSYFFSLQSGRNQSKTSLVEGLSETETKATNYGINLSGTLMDTVSVFYGYTSESINQNIVSNKEYTIAPSLMIKNFSIGFSYSQKKVLQNTSYVFLTQDYQNDLNYIQTINKVSVGYKFTDYFSLSASQSRFSYNKDMETAYNLLSIPFLATNNGTDMLSQIYALLDSTVEISGIYNFDDLADLEVSLGKTVDFYSPKATTHDIRIGVLVYQTAQFSWGLGVTSSRSTGEEKTANRSYDANVSFAF